MVESALIDVENKTISCDMQIIDEKIEEQIEESIAIFIEAIEETENLSVIGTAFNNRSEEVFVIEDANSTGLHIEVVISEIVEKVKNITVAREFVKIIQGGRSPIILNGITRIVGYFSRVNNWNRSKIGELRDRRKGEYSVNGC